MFKNVFELDSHVLESALASNFTRGLSNEDAWYTWKMMPYPEGYTHGEHASVLMDFWIVWGFLPSSTALTYPQSPASHAYEIVRDNEIGAFLTGERTLPERADHMRLDAYGLAAMRLRLEVAIYLSTCQIWKDWDAWFNRVLETRTFERVNEDEREMLVHDSMGGYFWEVLRGKTFVLDPTQRVIMPWMPRTPAEEKASSIYWNEVEEWADCRDVWTNCGEGDSTDLYVQWENPDVHEKHGEI